MLTRYPGDPVEKTKGFQSYRSRALILIYTIFLHISNGLMDRTKVFRKHRLRVRAPVTFQHFILKIIPKIYLFWEFRPSRQKFLRYPLIKSTEWIGRWFESHHALCFNFFKKIPKHIFFKHQNELHQNSSFSLLVETDLGHTKLVSTFNSLQNSLHKISM